MDIEIIAEGLEFPEGPIAMPDGSVVFVEIKGKRLSRWRPGAGVETVAEMRGGPNGAALGPDGKIYVCNNGGFEFHENMGLTIPGNAPDDWTHGSIDRVDLDSGAVEELIVEVEGNGLRGPNDIVFDRSGGFWFTDHGKSFSRQRDYGGLYYVSSDLKTLREVAYPMPSPNGVGLSPDEKTVYVADTVPGRLFAFDVTAPGEVAPPAIPGLPGRCAATLPGHQFVDSLAVEADGKICVATILNGGITVFDPDGSFEHVEMPDLIVTNICFGGADMRDAYVTLSGTGKLARLRWPRPGLKLNFLQT